MFSICVIVAIAWSLKAISEIFLLFFAISQITKVRAESESCKQLLSKSESIKRIERRRETGECAVRGLAVVIEFK